MRVQRWRVGAAVALATFACAATSARDARADASTEARAAYDRGLAAHEHGDEKAAAREFAQADALVPSSEALEAAVASTLRAGDAVLGMTLVERARMRSLDASAGDTVERARRAFAPRVMIAIVDCANASVCTAAVDEGPAVDARAPLVMLAANHTIVILRDKNRQIVKLASAGGETFPISPPAPSASDRAPDRLQRDDDDHAITRPVAFAAIGLTLVLGGLSIASGIDTRAKRSDFDREQCGTDSASGAPPGPDCAHFSDAGHSAQLRTNWLIAGTALAGVSTLVFIIDTKPFGSRSRVALSASATGIRAAFSFASP